MTSDSSMYCTHINTSKSWVLSKVWSLVFPCLGISYQSVRMPAISSLGHFGGFCFCCTVELGNFPNAELQRQRNVCLTRWENRSTVLQCFPEQLLISAHKGFWVGEWGWPISFYVFTLQKTRQKMILHNPEALQWRFIFFMIGSFFCFRVVPTVLEMLSKRQDVAKQ